MRFGYLLIINPGHCRGCALADPNGAAFPLVRTALQAFYRSIGGICFRDPPGRFADCIFLLGTIYCKIGSKLTTPPLYFFMLSIKRPYITGARNANNINPPSTNGPLSNSIILFPPYLVTPNRIGHLAPANPTQVHQ